MNKSTGHIHPELHVIGEPEQFCLNDGPEVVVVFSLDRPTNARNSPLQAYPRSVRCAREDKRFNPGRPGIIFA